MAPVFDVSRQALILQIEDGTVVSGAIESIETPRPGLKPERLQELRIQTLVCGAISEPLQHELAVRGVNVIGFVAGELNEVVATFLAGRLPTWELSMPGCRGKQQRFRGGSGRGGGRGGKCRRQGRA